MMELPAADAPAAEWGQLAVSIPGAPAAWHRTEELILVTGDGQHIASDGTWWRPVACAAGLLSLDVDHPATAGCLLALLGPSTSMTNRPDGTWWVGERRLAKRWWGDGVTLGRACIAAAAANGRWPGGEG